MNEINFIFYFIKHPRYKAYTYLPPNLNFHQKTYQTVAAKQQYHFHPKFNLVIYSVYNIIFPKLLNLYECMCHQEVKIARLKLTLVEEKRLDETFIRQTLTMELKDNKTAKGN